MSAAIKKALSNLDKAIDRMETGITKRPPAKASKSAPQPDLFSPSSNVVGFDRNALAKKLDMTIEKVEQLLGEA